MAILTEPKVELIAWTEFQAPPHIQDLWTTDSEYAGQSLVEFAGRACYASWSNPAGRSNEQYIQNVLEMGHLSVFEHGNASFYIEAVSRSLSHEYVRHRHFSYSQLSQRYVPDREGNWVIPPDVAKDTIATEIWLEAMHNAQVSYDKLLDRMTEISTGFSDLTARRKHARQAARSVLSNSTETRFVASGNYRAWRHFFRLRCALAADVEIRRLALVLLTAMKRHVPAVFADFQFAEEANGDYAFTLNPFG